MFMNRGWVKAYAANRDLTIIPAKEAGRKEDFVKPLYRRFKESQGGVCIISSMKQNASFCSYVPKYTTDDSNYRIIRRARPRFLHYYFYILDPAMGPMSLRVATYLPFNLTFYLNGHSYLAAQLDLPGISYRKNDNAFLAIGDPNIGATAPQVPRRHPASTPASRWGPGLPRETPCQTEMKRHGNRKNKIKVFISSRDSKCDECSKDLGRGAWIVLQGNDKGATCLSCADLDHLVFLPSGDAALTRRSRKHSKLVAVVLKWSRARKRYERRGLLVENEAVERAEHECEADANHYTKHEQSLPGR